MLAVYFRVLCRFLFLALLFTYSHSGFGQKITLNGTVSDTKTALPLEGVSVQFSSKQKVVFTNSQGSFSLATDTIFSGATLTFSHLSYQTLILKIKPGQTNFQVKLQPRSNAISEVKITANKKLKPAKVRPETVVDYALKGNQLFVLAWEKDQEKPSLLALDRQTDTLQKQYRLPFYAENLFVDCLENLHILTQTQAYQLYSDAAGFRFDPPHTRDEFDRTVVPCVAATPEKIYFRRNVNKGVFASFFTINRQTDQTQLLQTVRDELVLTMQSSEAWFQFFRAGGGDASMSMNRNGGSAAVKALFAQKIMFEAPYLPLLKIKDELYLFDHANGKLERYKNDSLRQVIPINYHLQKGWAREIIVDEITQKTYAHFQKNGLYQLKLLNLETGVTETTYSIPNPFASKISVWNGQVYFLYKDPEKQNRQFLYKAPLSIF